MTAFEIKKEYMIGLLQECKTEEDLKYINETVGNILINLEPKFLEKIFNSKGHEGVTDLIALGIQSRFLRGDC